MIASLPWYDLPELQPALDALWTGIARRLRAAGLPGVPLQLERRLSCFAQWRRRDLLLSQACGADVVRATGRQLQVVGVPHLRAPGCSEGAYRSWIVVRDSCPDEHLSALRGRSCAINNVTSHSGHLALRAMVKGLATERGRGFFGQVRVTGSHVESLRLVRSGACEVASIDCVTWALLAAHRPQALTGLKITAATALAPAPPYVTGWGTAPDTLQRLRDAIRDAFADPALAAARDDLLLDDFRPADRCDYAELAA